MSENLNAKELAKELLTELGDDQEVKDKLSAALDWAKPEVQKLLTFGEIEFNSWDELDNAAVLLRAEKLGATIIKKFAMLLVSRVLAHFGLSDVGKAFNEATAKKNESLREKEAEQAKERAADSEPAERVIVDVRTGSEDAPEKPLSDDIPSTSSDIPASLGDAPTSDKPDLGGADGG